MSNALAKAELRTGGRIAAIIPQSAEELFRLAQMIAVSGLAPKGMDRPEAITAAIAHGLEIGLAPMQAVQSIAVVNGRPTVWGDAAMGLVRGSGLLEDVEETVTGEGEAMVATCTARRRDQASPIVRTFSAQDAKRAGLWGKQGPWQQYPRRMLQLRARAFALRDGFADVLKGLQVTEEVRDYHAAPARPGITEAPRSRAITAADILAPAKDARDAPEAVAVDVEADPVDPPAQAPEIDAGGPDATYAPSAFAQLMDEAADLTADTVDDWSERALAEIKALAQTDRVAWRKLNDARNAAIARFSPGE